MTTVRAIVKPALLHWAIRRSSRKIEELRKRFKGLNLWLKEEAKPTLKQLEDFAKAVYVPIGYFFLDNQPEEKIPIPDFRTVGNREVERIPKYDIFHIGQEDIRHHP